MTMPDPFNPRPGTMPGDDRHQYYRDLEAGDGGKAFLWVPLAVVGAIAAFAVIASL